MSGTKQLEVPRSPLTRVSAFLDAFRAASADADIELRLGHGFDGETALVISIAGEMHALKASEARKVADMLENVMNKYPDDPDAQTFPNLILMLRHGAAQ